MWLKFELTKYNVTILHISYYNMGTPFYFPSEMKIRVSLERIDDDYD